MRILRIHVTAAPHRLILVALGLSAAGIVLFCTARWGVGLSPDSVRYIATARNARQGAGFVSYDGTPLTVQPPLYPALLAGVEWIFGVDPLASARFVNAFLFGLIVSLTGLLFFQHLNTSVAIVLLGTVFVLVENSFVVDFLYAWSEPLFICFMLLYLVHTDSYLAKGDLISLLLLAAPVALAWMTRYIGITLFVSGAATILVFRRDRWKIKLWHLLLFTFISVAPISIWVSRNFTLSKTLFGPLPPPGITLTESLNLTIDAVTSWYLPHRIAEHRRLLALFSVVIGSFLVVGLRATWPKLKPRVWQLGPISTFVFVYVGLLVHSTLTFGLDPIYNRYLSPVFVPATLVILFFLCEAAKLLTARFSPQLVNALLAVVIVALMVSPARATASLVAAIQRQGLGFNSESWTDSQTIHYLLQHRTLATAGTIYSNVPEVVYIQANLAAKSSPLNRMYNSSEPGIDVSNLRGTWPKEDLAYLVWFNRKRRTFQFTLDELQAIATFKQVAQLADGAIYTVEKNHH